MTDSLTTPLAIYKLLPKTNCGRCLLPSCLAFAAAVVAGDKKIRDCLFVEPAEIAAVRAAQRSESMEILPAEFMDKLKEKMVNLDLSQVAHRLGGNMSGRYLVINSLGKDFFIDAHGNITSECHIIPWIQAPLLAYITNKTHQDITGRWISFREINGGIEWQGLFSSRCELPLRKLADENKELLGDLIDLFMGKEVDWYQADIALILYPLPKIPILICYQGQEDDIDSALTIFFDECCPQNLHIKSLFTLCSGLVQMFAKIAERHQ